MNKSTTNLLAGKNMLMDAMNCCFTLSECGFTKDPSHRFSAASCSPTFDSPPKSPSSRISEPTTLLVLPGLWRPPITLLLDGSMVTWINTTSTPGRCGSQSLSFSMASEILLLPWCVTVLANDLFCTHSSRTWSGPSCWRSSWEVCPCTCHRLCWLTCSRSTWHGVLLQRKPSSLTSSLKYRRCSRSSSSLFYSLWSVLPAWSSLPSRLSFPTIGESRISSPSCPWQQLPSAICYYLSRLIQPWWPSRGNRYLRLLFCCIR